MIAEKELYALSLDEYLKVRHERAKKVLEHFNPTAEEMILFENIWLKQYIQRRIK